MAASLLRLLSAPSEARRTCSVASSLRVIQPLMRERLCYFTPITSFVIYPPPPPPTNGYCGDPVGVAPDRKQLTAVQEAHNKGHNEAGAGREVTERVCVCVNMWTIVFWRCHAEWSEG